MQILDTNVLVRHFTGFPKHHATAATSFLSEAAPSQLWLTDVHVSELVWVLESSIYQANRAKVALALDAVLALPAIEVADESLLQTALWLYAQRGMDWADAYLVATAQGRSAPEVVSYDRFDAKLSGTGVQRIEPSAT